MILGKRRAVAVLAATAIVASGAMWAPAAAQTPTNCAPVPGGTAGTSVKVGDQRVVVPAISNIQLCTGGATAPEFRVEQEGGLCTTACFSVYVVGGTLSAGTITVSWVETDGTTSTPKSQTIDPEDVTPPVDETCVFSTGAPVPADEDCEIAVGIVPPPDAIGPFVDMVEALVTDVGTIVDNVYTMACGTVPDDYDESSGQYIDFCTNPTGYGIEVGTDAVQTTCDAVPDRYDPDTGQTYDACLNTTEWATSLAKELLGTTCDAVPDRTDPETWQTYDFCTDPVGWGGSTVGDPVEITCSSIPDWYDPQTGQTYDFCTDPSGWTDAVTRYAIQTCDSILPVYDEYGQEYRMCTDPVGWVNVWVQFTERTCNNAWPVYDYERGEYVYPCKEPVRWLDVWCGDLCNLPPIQELIREIRVIIAEQQIKIYWSHLP